MVLATGCRVRDTAASLMQEMRAAYDAGSYRRALRLCITVLETEPAHFEAAQAAPALPPIRSPMTRSSTARAS